MTLAKTTILGLAMLTLGVCLAGNAMAQSNPPAKSAKTHAKTAKAPKAARTAHAAKPAKAESNAASAPAATQTAAVPHRDPFMPLISEQKQVAGNEHLPPGKAGLVITSVRVDGAVRSDSGMIAVLSNADQRTYFVREGDRLYDGEVEKIGLDGVTFRQNSKDAFGKAVERVVTKRIYTSAGEQQ